VADSPLVHVPSIDFLRDRIGQEVAVSDWIAVAQARIDQFADATDDHQWIHVDPTRAAVESPFRTTIAHGFLTLSLVSALARMAMTLPSGKMGVNYGLNKVRFVAPVPSGVRIRGRFTPIEVQDLDGSAQITWHIIVEREGSEKPCMVADWIVRYYR
jgi:acyl dehydratase